MGQGEARIVHRPLWDADAASGWRAAAVSRPA